MDVKMRYFAFALFVLAACLGARADWDHIIFRSGNELDVKLYQVNDQRIVYSTDRRQQSERFEVPSTDVYMVYVDGQGNVYLTPEGQRVTGEPQRANRRKNDVIYLVSGREIAAENIRITPDVIKYDVRSGGGGFLGRGGGQITEEQLPKNEVFMICYRNGMNDIITPIDTPPAPPVEEPAPEPAEPQYTVVFYSTERGDTLETVAARYGVTVEQLKEWNDLPNQRPTSTLRTGMQLMVYQLQTPAQ